MKEIYEINFQKIKIEDGGTMFYADSSLIENSELAHHLTVSGKESTNLQILDLELALSGQPIQEDWGEINGSILYIYQMEKMVQVGYSTNLIPIQDFKKLLVEWQAFIS
jgi:hypothetical protein